MNWSAALFAATIWMIAAALWQMYRPMPVETTHRRAAFRVFQDIAPAMLLALLMARVM
jgi:hypothetical protein